MIEKGLVSVLTPCFNGEKFIDRLLDSILLQDYRKIEFIFVDDGSIDSTGDVITNYKQKFVNKQYRLEYVYQKNKGQAAAINAALQKANGEFFIWPDADDYFCSTQIISKMVKTFDGLDSSYGYIRCWAKMVNEKNLQQVCISRNKVDSECLFQSFLDGTESHAAAGTYMFKMSAFEAVNPTRTIFDKFRPQNCQLLLPMAYKYKCYTIKEPLHAIVLRTGSHSRREKDYSQQIATIDSYVEIHNKTLEGMSLPKDELHEYKLCCLNKLLLQKLDVALDYRKKKEALSFYSEIKMYGLHLSRGKIIKVYLLIISPVLLDIVMCIKKWRVFGCK